MAEETKQAEAVNPVDVRAKPIKWDEGGSEWLDENGLGFHIEYDESYGPAPFIATWGEGDSESFETIDEAKAWCQACIDGWVKDLVVVEQPPVTGFIARNEDPIALVLVDVYNERLRQLSRWGVQHRPSVDPVLLQRPGGVTPERLAAEYEVPTEDRAKLLVELSAQRNELTWAHICIEELAEAIGCLDDERARYVEVVQAAACFTAWAEDLRGRGAHHA